MQQLERILIVAIAGLSVVWVVRRAPTQPFSFGDGMLDRGDLSRSKSNALRKSRGSSSSSGGNSESGGGGSSSSSGQQGPTNVEDVRSKPVEPEFERMSAADVLAELGSSGAASLDQLKAAMRFMGASPTEAEAGLYHAELVREGAALTVPLLESIMARHREAHPPEQERAELQEAWGVIDGDGNGRVEGVERADLIELLTTVGEPLTDEEMQLFLQDVDANGDGIIERSEFMDALGGGGE